MADPNDPWAPDAAPSLPATAEPAPKAGTWVWDVQAGRPAYMPVDQAQQALDDPKGNYVPYSATQVTTEGPQGQHIVRSPSQGQGAVEAGEPQVSGSAESAAQGSKARQEQFDTILDGARTAADQFMDAASLGLLHEHGEDAEIRNSRHKLAGFLGATVAFVATAGAGAEAKAANTVEKGAAGVLKKAMRGGTPLGWVEQGLGKVAHGVIPEATSLGGKVAVGAAREAIVNAGIAAAHSTGAAASDALVGDPGHLQEHLSSEVPLGLLLGGAFGGASAFVAHLIDREAAIGALSAQDGLANPTSAVSKEVHGAFDGAIRDWEGVTQKRAAQLDIIRRMVKDGSLKAAADLVGPREIAYKAVIKARQALDKLDLATISATGSAKDIEKYAATLDAYGAATNNFDRVMRSSEGELGLVARPAGPVTSAPAPQGERIGTGMGEGGPDEAALHLDELMTPEKRAQYRELHGRDYEPMPEEATGLGGQETPTSGDVTRPGSRPRGAQVEMAAQPTPEALAPERGALGEDTMVGGANDTQVTPAPQRAGRTGPAPEITRVDPSLPEMKDIRTYAHEVDLLPTEQRGQLDSLASELEKLPVEPTPPPEIVEKLASGRAKLSDGSEVWRSEHRKMVNEYKAAMKSYEAESGKLEQQLRDSIKAPEETTKVIPKVDGAEPTRVIDRGEPTLHGKERGDLDRLNEFTHQATKTPAVVTRHAAKTIKELIPAGLVGSRLEKTVVDLVSAGQMARASKVVKAASRGERGLMDTLHDPMPLGKEVGPHAQPIGPTQGAHVIHSGNASYNWLQQLAREPSPHAHPGSIGAAKVQARLKDLERLSGGRFTQVKALEVAQALGVKNVPRGPLAEKAVQLWALRQMGKEAVAASKGGKSFLAKKMASMAMGGVGYHVGGVVGGMFGHALGWAADLGSVAGRARKAALYAADALLKNERGKMMARAFTHAAQDHANSGHQEDALTHPRGDMKQRVEHLRLSMQDPDGTRQNIRNSLGDLASVNPDLAKGIENTTMNRLQALSVRAPTYLWQGVREVGPTVHEERRYKEFEAATWDPHIILDAVANGSMTTGLAEVLMVQHPELQRVLTSALMSDPEALKKMSMKQLRQIELITGLPLTRGSDPAFVLRQQMSTPPPAPQAAGPTQALKLSAETTPTPSQAGPRAPGN